MVWRKIAIMSSHRKPLRNPYVATSHLFREGRTMGCRQRVYHLKQQSSLPIQRNLTNAAALGFFGMPLKLMNFQLGGSTESRFSNRCLKCFQKSSNITSPNPSSTKVRQNQIPSAKIPQQYDTMNSSQPKFHKSITTSNHQIQFPQKYNSIKPSSTQF